MAKTDLRWMPNTIRLLADRGVTSETFLSNHPLCCPARAEILTGQYAHNNGVHSNRGPRGGYHSLDEPGNHVGSWLERSGYQTAFVGKHLNGWERIVDRQPGWTVFDPILKGIHRPYGLTMYDNGQARLYKGIHTADLIGRLTIRYIDRFSAGGAPFFVWASQAAPHTMLVNGEWVHPVPAARHRDLYPNALPPSLSHPAFNETDVTDKPTWVQGKSGVSRAAQVAHHRARIRSLRSVDEQVARTVEALRSTNELGHTYIFFTSDNGFLLGEHRITGKNSPYEASLRVPLLARGPSLPAGAVRRQMYGMVDLAPTFVALSGAEPGRILDGRSMLATLRSGEQGYRHYLVQAAEGRAVWWWRGIRSSRYVYVRYEDGFEELYDLVNDPGQLQNVAYSGAYAHVRAQYAGRLTLLQTCSGQTCQTGVDFRVDGQGAHSRSRGA